MKISGDRLDPQCVQYLKDLEAQSGRGFHGIYIPRLVGWLDGPRGGWWLALFAGIAMLAGAVLLSQPRVLADMDLLAPAFVQGGLVGVGVLLFLTGIVRFFRKSTRTFARPFLFADALHLWHVYPDRVDAWDLTDLENAEGVHRHVNHRYDKSSVTLTFAGGARTFWVDGHRPTEQLLKFLNVLIAVRNSNDSATRGMVNSPEQLGAFAARVAKDTGRGGVYPTDPGPPLPTPQESNTTAPAAGPGWGGVVIRWAAAAAVGAVAIFALPILNRRIMDESYYAKIPKTDFGDLYSLERYLKLYPNGRHTAEVRTWYDDRLFTRAKREAEQSNSPSSARKYLADAANSRHRDEAQHVLDDLDDRLFERIKSNDGDPLTHAKAYQSAYPDGRHAAELAVVSDDAGFARAKRLAEKNDDPGPARAYLADAANTRHRDDAKKLIHRCYDATVEQLKERSQGAEARVDPELFAAIIALVNSLRDAPVPVVSVGFKATIDAEPVTDAQKEFEKLQLTVHTTQKPELKEIATKLGGSPILPRGAVFDPDQIARREQVILERLSAAVQRGVKGEFMTFRASRADEFPTIEVAYHISPATLYTYTVTEGNRYGVPNIIPPTPVVKGLLRSYSIDWTITVRPIGIDEGIVCKLGSSPAEKLNYTQSPSDPDWAPYAILLYSSFYDMSARMIRNFALDPGKAPNTFTFNAAASEKPDEPAYSRLSRDAAPPEIAV